MSSLDFFFKAEAIIFSLAGFDYTSSLDFFFKAEAIIFSLAGFD
jgi:hypothetical protein